MGNLTNSYATTPVSEYDATKVATYNAALQVLDSAINGRLPISITGGTTTLTGTPAAPQAQNLFLDVSGTLSSNATIEIPIAAGTGRNRLYVVKNGTTGAHTVTVKKVGGTGVAVTQGQTAILFYNDTDIVGLYETGASAASVTASKLLGRGSGGGTGAEQEISLGTNLSMSGTTLNASAGAGSLFALLSDYASFNAAVTAIGSTPTTLFIDGAATSITNVTVPATLTLHFLRSGSLGPSNSNTITIVGHIFAELDHQIFTNALSGQGTISLAGQKLPEVSPVWWGAVGDNSTDCQGAFQAAITALSTAKGGEMRIPIGVYVIGGSQDATSHGMLTFPWNASASQIQYRIIGETRPGTGVFDTSTDKGVIIKCTVSGVNSDSAVFSAGAYLIVDSLDDLNYISPHFENLTIRTNGDPSRHGLQFSNSACFSANNVIVDTGQLFSAITEPTNDRAGMWLPINGNFAFIRLKDTYVIGYNHGYRYSEHCEFSNAWAVKCQVGFLGEQGFHLNRGTLEVEWCPIMFRWSDSGTVDFHVAMERYDNPASGAGGWWESVGTDLVEDTAGNAHGTINFKMAIAGIGETSLVPQLASPTTNFENLRLRSMWRPAEGIRLHSTGQTITTGTDTALTWDSEPRDVMGMHVTNASAVTILLTGWYDITVMVQWAASSAGTYRRAWVDINSGAAIIAYDTSSALSATEQTVNKIAQAVFLHQGDVLVVKVRHDKGSNLVVENQNYYAPLFSVTPK